MSVWGGGGGGIFVYVLRANDPNPVVCGIAMLSCQFRYSVLSGI